jgi:hypothetical protein
MFLKFLLIGELKIFFKFLKEIPLQEYFSKEQRPKEMVLGWPWEVLRLIYIHLRQWAHTSSSNHFASVELKKGRMIGSGVSVGFP